MIQPPMVDLSAVAFAALMAFAYLFVLRLIDLNEKEPLWAIGLLFALGACGAAILAVVVSSVYLARGAWTAAVAETATIAAAIGVGLAALNGIGRLRGWREVGDAMDGIVYGVAAGLGFATCLAFIRDVSISQAGPGAMALMSATPLWTAAVSGLAYGMLGGIIGALCAMAAERASLAARAALVFTGCLLAALANASFLILARGNALGASSLTRLWLALVIPPIGLLLVGWYALRQEHRAIQQHLPPEIDLGVLTAGDLAALDNLVLRTRRSWGRLAAGRFESWGALKLLQNRLVQLALAKRRVARAPSYHSRTIAAAEVARLRSTIAEIRVLAEEAQ